MNFSLASRILPKFKTPIVNMADGSLQADKTAPVLWILPLLHLLTALVVQRRFGYFFLWVTDPEYFHLMSGVALGQLHLDVAYINHPGTPIQIAVALSSWINFLISGKNNIYMDVAENPEQYIFAANLLFNLVLMWVMFWVGKKSARITGNINAALLLQLGFFANFSIIRVTGRLLPETFLLLPVAVLMVLMLQYVYYGIPREKEKKQLILFSIVMGWGTATKLSFAPFIIIPLILFPGIKNKLRLIAFSVVAFFLAGFPILSHMNNFFHWIGNMFTHTGNWGKGSSGFMDLSLFPARLQQLFHYNPPLFILMLFLFIESVWFGTTKKITPFLRRYLKISFGTIATVSILVFLICKQFALHYLIPLTLLNGFFLLMMIIPFVKDRKANYLYFAGVIAALIFSINALARFSENPFPSLNEQEKKICTFREKVDKNGLLIISGHWAGTPFKAYSLTGGMLLSGPAMKVYKQPMHTVYPNTYMYYGWTKKFFNWGNYVNSTWLLKKNRPVFIYTGKEKEKDLQKILSRFRRENPGYRFGVDTLVGSAQYPERLYKLIFSEKP